MQEHYNNLIDKLSAARIRIANSPYQPIVDTARKSIDNLIESSDLLLITDKEKFNQLKNKAQDDLTDFHMAVLARLN